MSTLIIGSAIWNDDNKLRRVFAWLTRIGAAPKFGTLPIHYYQQDQCAAIEKLEKCAKDCAIDLETAPVRCRNCRFEARVDGQWKRFASLFVGKIID